MPKFYFNQQIKVKTELADIAGHLVHLDEEGQLALVSIDGKRAPEWFREAHHNDPCPHVWVSLKDVEEA